MEAEMAIENKEQLFENMVNMRQAQDRSVSFATKV